MAITMEVPILDDIDDDESDLVCELFDAIDELRDLITDRQADTVTGDYLTVDELATRLRCSAPTIRRRQAQEWRLGEHFVQPLGQGTDVLFYWPGVRRWLHTPRTEKPKQNEKLTKEQIHEHIASRANALLG